MPEGIIPRERIAAIVNRVLPEFGGDQDAPGSNNYYGHATGGVVQAGPLDSMASAIADGSEMTKGAALRRLAVIRNGSADFSRVTGERTAGNLTFATADAILSGLGLTHLWWTELADLYDPDYEQEAA